MNSYRVIWRTRSGKVEAAFTEADNAAHAQHIIERHYGSRLKEVVAITELDFGINDLDIKYDIIMSDNDNPTIDEVAPFLGKYKSRLFYKYNADLECNILHITYHNQYIRGAC